MIGKTEVTLPLDGGGSGITLNAGYTSKDIKYISNRYYLKTLKFTGGDVIVKAIRLLYTRTGKQAGEAFDGYMASSATELLNKYPFIK